MSGFESECLFVILPELYHPTFGYQLSTIWPGLGGTYETDFYCGHDLDLAMEYANELNAVNGHTPEFVTAALEIVSGLDHIGFYNAQESAMINTRLS